MVQIPREFISVMVNKNIWNLRPRGARNGTFRNRRGTPAVFFKKCRFAIIIIIYPMGLPCNTFCVFVFIIIIIYSMGLKNVAQTAVSHFGAAGGVACLLLAFREPEIPCFFENQKIQVFRLAPENPNLHK